MSDYIVTDKIRVNIVHSVAVPPRVKCEQYDGDYTRQIEATIYNGDVLYEIPSLVRRIVISGLKPDATGFSYDCTWSGSKVLFSLMRQMTVIPGDVVCNISMFDASNNQVSSAVFVLAVEKAALPSDVVVSSNDFQTFVDYVQAAHLYSQYSKSYAVGNTGVRNGENTDNSQYYAHLARMYKGSPLTAATASAMTDVTRVYVYVGSEDGYNNGHWYFYNDLTWEDGGVFNAQGQQTDTELITPGIAADAKAVGDILGNETLETEAQTLRGAVNELDSNIANITPDMYGAVGDGVTDDSQAFVDAITACISKGKSLIVPNKTYLLSSVIDMRGISSVISYGTIHGEVILGGNLTNYSNSHYYQFRNIDTITLKDSRCNAINFDCCTTLNIDSRTTSNYYNQITGEKIGTVNIMSSNDVTDYFANSNSFYVRSIKNLYINGAYKNNDNNFHDASFENGVVNIASGRNNYIECRGESLSDVTFGADTYDNKIFVAQGYEMYEDMVQVRDFVHQNGCFKLPRSVRDLHVYPVYELQPDNVGNVDNLGPYGDSQVLYKSRHTGAEIVSFNIPIREEFSLVFNSDDKIRVVFEIYAKETGNIVTDNLFADLFNSRGQFTFDDTTYKYTTEVKKNHHITCAFLATNKDKYIMKVHILTSSSAAIYSYIKVSYLTYGFTGITPIVCGNFGTNAPNVVDATFKLGAYVKNVGSGAMLGWRFNGTSWDAIYNGTP